MALSIFKPGQGYWTRVLTAVGLGLIAVAGAAWLWSQVGAIRFPARAWSVSVSNVTGAVTPGQHVSLMTDGEQRRAIGAADVLSADFTTGVVQIENVRMTGSALVSATQRIETPDGAFVAAARRLTAIPVIEPVYVQAAVAGVVIIFSAAFIYWLVGVKQRPIEFFIAVDNEMHKVNWSSRREVVGSTWVVITVCLAITVVLFVVDLGFSSLFRAIGVLDVD